jgi:hypothetical protein
MAVISRLPRTQGVNAFTQAYASTSAPALNSVDGGVDIHVCYAALTGAMTINAGVSGLLQWQRVFFHFTADTTARIVTLGTGFDLLSAPQMEGATFQVNISSDALLECVYDGTALRVVSLISEGRAATVEQPAYAASIEVTDQSAKEHLLKPATLTGALTYNATAVTKHKLGDRFVFMFATDGTQRIVTFGTNILSSGTITIPASKTATAVGWFDGTSIRISNREISA